VPTIREDTKSTTTTTSQRIEASRTIKKSCGYISRDISSQVAL
jgi:hypothetical protein